MENQYTQLRTPAKEYYYEGETLNEFYAKFEEKLLKYAREKPRFVEFYADLDVVLRGRDGARVTRGRAARSVGVCVLADEKFRRFRRR